MCGALFQLMSVAGGFCVIVALAYTRQWESGFLYPGYIGMFVSVFVWVCPESPHFHLHQHRVEQGRVCLQRLRQGDASPELDAIMHHLEQTAAVGSVSFVDLFCKPGLRKRFFLACYMRIGMQLTGASAFLIFQTDVFQSAGFAIDKINSVYPPGPAMVLSFFAMVFVVVGLALIDSKFGGRRRLLLITAAMMGPAAFLGAATEILSLNPKIIMVVLVVYVMGFQSGWGTVPWVYPAELFTMQERDRALGLAMFAGFVTQVIVVGVSKVVYDHSHALMWITFGVVGILNFVVSATLVKETKGVRLCDVPALFDCPGKALESKTSPLVDP
jgi:hypothetical protein